MHKVKLNKEKENRVSKEVERRGRSRKKRGRESVKGREEIEDDRGWHRERSISTGLSEMRRDE